MSNNNLAEIVTKTIAKGRISFGDVRRLQRDVLPDGVSSREEVELLLSLDAAAAQADRSWTEWLVPAIVDFVVWGERPTGLVEAGAASWLTAALGAGGTPTKAARLIAREIAREAERVDEAVITFAFDTTPAQPAAEALIPAVA
ncbi:hypothetical protein [Salinarimonas soli]|uniref:Uncharacterized protein n=1 Tax=Salinarimonas soli TaxID=1638099 RepID=A0A5B2VEH9_9HYPH|nr:hypothetical protein [Salinarimonas soli]KAA2237384.1 hypothetical protein F0L46_10315 [Salinarimonas soli]